MKKNRAYKIRAKLKTDQPRLTVFRSNKHIYAQIIDMIKSKTIIGISDKKIISSKENKIQTAFKVGQLIADLSMKKGIKKIIFDKGPYKYHGRVKALADGARKSGLEF